MTDLASLPVDAVDHGGQRGRLTAPDRSRDQDEAARQKGELLHEGGEVQLFKGGNSQRNVTEDEGGSPPLKIEVGPEASQAGDADGEVEFPLLKELLLLRRGEDLIRDPLQLLDARRGLVEHDEGSVHADLRPGSDLQMQVARPLFQHGLQDASKVHFAPFVEGPADRLQRKEQVSSAGSGTEAG